MDTNAKKYKYSPITKLLCIILAAITFTAASGLGALTVLSVLYNDTSKNTINVWTDSDEFQNYFSQDISSVFYNSHLAAEQRKLQKELVKKKGHGC
ncbi:MAG: hypothetical protein NC397_01320 [Clostridium sp.]|nr:hypothetical protein [Clostridium sp.]